MHKKRKLLSLLLAAAMVLSLLPASALAAEADAVSSMEETAEAPGASAEPKLIAAWAPLDEPAIEVEPGVAERSLGLPETLGATVEGSDTAVAVTWSSEPEYDPDAEGVYVFTAAPAAEGYALEEGLEPPTVTVTVAEEAPEAAPANVVLDAEPRATSHTDRHPTADELSSIGYSFANGYTVTIETDGNLYLNGREYNSYQTLSIKVLQHTSNHRALFLSQPSKLKATPKWLASSDTNYNGFTVGNTWAKGSLEINVPQSLDELYIDADGHIYYTYISMFENYSNENFYLSATGFTNSTSGLPTTTVTVTWTAGANSRITGGTATQTIAMGGAISAITVTPDTHYAMPETWANMPSGMTYKKASNFDSTGAYVIGGVLKTAHYIQLPDAVSNAWTITLTKGDHMSGTNLSQTVDKGQAITAIVLTPDSGYTLPDENDAAWASVKGAGLTVSKNSTTGTVTISGTPTKSLTDAALPAGEAPAAPTVAVTDMRAAGTGLSQKVTATLTVTGPVQGVQYQYSVNGGTTWQNATLSESTFTVSDLRYGDHIQVRAGAGTAAMVRVLDTALRNGGFETITAPGAKLISGTSIYAWRTTASDGFIEVDSPGSYGVTFFEGKYCAELNAYEDASLYQEVATTPGAGFSWSLFHSGRTGPDTMALVIGPATEDSYKKADKNTNDLFQNIVASMTATDKVPGKTTSVDYDGKTYSVTIISDPKRWARYHAEYEIPSGQTETVFGFTSISAAGNKKDVGNLLDGIAFEKAPINLASGVDSGTGRGEVEISSPAPDGKYSLLHANGSPMTKEELDALGIAARDSNGTVITPADDGTYTWSNGNSGSLIFSVPAGERYTVQVDYGDEGKKTKDTIVPAVGESQLSSGITGSTEKKASVTISPADPSMKYALVSKDGNNVMAPWSAGGKTSVTFPGLGPAAEYKVVAKPATDVTTEPTAKKDSGADLKTPAGTLQNVTADGVSRDDGTGGKDKIVLDPTVSGQEYGVYDPATGLTEWKESTGGKLDFDGLDPDKDYEVVTRTPGTPPSIPGPGVSVPAATVKPGDVTNGADANGKASITVTGTDPDTKYAVVDSQGNVVAPSGTDKDGWLSGNNGALTFPGLNAGDDYKVVTVPKKNGDTDPTGGGNDKGGLYPENILTTDDQGLVGPTVKVPAVSEDQLSAEIKTDGAGNKTASVTIDPTDRDLSYGLVTKDEHGNFIEVTPAGDWKSGAGGTVTFDGLDPNKEYVVVAKPTTGDGSDAATTDKGGSGAAVKTPAESFEDIAAGSVSREDSATQGKDKIVLKPTDTNQEYAVVDKETGEVVTDTNGDPIWKTGVGDSALEFDGLDSNKDYAVITRTQGTPPSTPGKGVDVPKTTVKPGDVSNSTGADGKGVITVGKTDPDIKYAVVDKTTGKVVAPVGADGDGWLSGKTDGGALSFPGLNVGGDYQVVTVPKQDAADKDSENPGTNTPGDPYSSEPGASVGPGVRVPAVTEDQLSGAITGTEPNKKATVTVSPADQDMEYGLVTKNPDGSFSAVTPAGDWQAPGADGKVEFTGLDPEQEYIVVAKPATGSGSDVSTTDKGGSGTAIKTPTDKTVAGEKIDRDTNTTGANDGKDKLTIKGDGTSNGYDYAVVDKTTGKVVAPVDTTGDGTKDDADGWQQGGSGDLTFDGLDPNKEYEVVMRPHTDGGAIGVPAPGVTVGKVGAVDVTGVVKDENGQPVAGAKVAVEVATIDGGTRKLEAVTGPDGKYELSADAGVKLPGDYTLVVESGKGCKAQAVQLDKTSSQQTRDVTVKAAVTSLVTGLVNDPATGGPLKGADIVVIDKKTGLPVTLPTGTSVVSTDDAGAYVVDTSALPAGDYVIKGSGTAGSGNTAVTGLTEVRVDDKGTAKPIKPYKNTDVAPVPGGVLSGQVKDETGKGVANAEVTVTVPIQNMKPDGTVETIGTKKVTVTTGADGKYFVPGVPAGDYPVSVKTPGGSVAQSTVTVSGNTGKDDAHLTVPTEQPDHKNVVSGIVMDKDGKPVSGAAVTIYDKDGNKVATKPATVTTGQGGGWSVEGLDPAKGPFHASVDAVGGVNGVAGPFEVKADGTVKGGTNVALPGAVNTGTGTITGAESGKLLTGTVTDGATPAKPVSGATVVVKDSSGNVVASTKTDASGHYYVPNVLDGATVSVTTPRGETATGTITEVDGHKKADMVPGVDEDKLTVVGPLGGVLPLDKERASDIAAKVTVTGPKPAVTDQKSNISITDGKLAVSDLPDGTYAVTVEQGGMRVEKEIAVSGGKLTGDKTMTVPAHKVEGELKYGVGSIPTDAAVAITGANPNKTWGSSSVDPNTGKYEMPGVPEGSYTATVTVKDPEGSDITLTATATVDKDGKVSYGPWTDPGTSTGAGITAGTEGKLTVTPSTAVQTVIGKIDAANGADGTLEQIKDTMDALQGLTAEQKKQVDPDKVKDLSGKLESLLAGKLSIAAKAEGMKNTTQAKNQLESQRGLLVRDVVDTASTKKVDVDLSLVAENVTDSAPAKDARTAEAAAKGAEMGAYFDVSIKKTVKVTEEKTNTVLSTATEKVTEVPQPITITLPIPADIQGHAYYNVIRVHEGTAQRIPSSATKTQITFASTLYSTYAIVWSEDPIFPGDAPAEEDNGGGNQGGSSGSGGGSSSGSVVIDKTTGGKVTLSPASPEKDDKVTVTAKPDEGYTLDKLVIKDSKGNEIEYVDNGDGTYTYTQPKGKVSISATFRKVTGDPHDNGVDRLLIVDDHFAFMQGDPSGDFRPTGNITRAEVAQLFYNLLKDKDVNSGKTFSDVPADAWYAKAVTALAELGILNGRGEGIFDPMAPITRAEFASIAARFALRTSGTVEFTDVPETHWAYEAIGAAAYYGWINGYTDGTFKPDTNIARAEAAKVVNTMLGRSADKSYIDEGKADLKLFPDVAETNWAFYEIVEATNAHDFTLTDGTESWGK